MKLLLRLESPPGRPWISPIYFSATYPKWTQDSSQQTPVTKTEADYASAYVHPSWIKIIEVVK